MGKSAGIALLMHALVAMFSQNARAQQYTVTPISVSGYPNSSIVGAGVDNSGEVVGTVNGEQAFLYANGVGQRLLPLAQPENEAFAYAINTFGTVVGESSNTFAEPNAVSWQNGSVGPTDLGSLYYYRDIGSPAPAGYSSAAAINSNGISVGSSLGAAGGSASTDTHAALFSGGTVTDLGTLGGNDSEALGINDSGIIVGDADTTTFSHAFYYDGAMHDLGVLPGGTESSATAINSSGTIVGWSTTSGGSAHAVVWTSNGAGSYTILDLGSLGPLAGNNSQANAINDSGEIVGISATAQNGHTAFVYSNGVMTDLNSLLAPGSSVTLYEATAINASGQIVANSQNATGPTNAAYLLTPNTPPVSVPNVVGLAQTVARSTITSADLRVGTVSTQASATVPVGEVISQIPTAGATVRIGVPVNLVVSTGPVPPVTVPNVIGLVDGAAFSQIETAGLQVGTQTAQLSTVKPYYIIGQNPPSGTLVAAGSAVNVVIATNTTTTVPNVIGLPAIDATPNAESVLENANFFIGTETFQASPTIPANVVISQSPVAGTVIPILCCGTNDGGGGGVNLVLSSGPAEVMVPNVVGLTQAAATTSIITPGLVLGTVTNQPSSTVPSGSVISQSPAAGGNVPSGGSVNLVVSSGPATISIVLGGSPIYTGSATGWSVAVPVTNTGNVTAQTVQVLAAILNGAPAVSISAITLGPGATGNFVLNFPSATVGLTATLLVSGSYSGTSLSGNWEFGARASLNGIKGQK